MKKRVIIKQKRTFVRNIPAHCLSSSTDGMVEKNEAAYSGALTAVEAFVGGVGQLVADGVACCRDKVEQQQVLGVQDRDVFLQLLVRASSASFYH